jgi:hypothetical protein
MRRGVLQVYDLIFYTHVALKIQVPVYLTTLTQPGQALALVHLLWC